ncbi:protein PHYLLO [Carex littledalei]|uniref:Protein PHYLLO n=1 Tax=Carex littledalei TaxID=544730 RepID=A0A833QUN2_9POAL|nr:protein PHYLLO [Carex littledalei]
MQIWSYAEAMQFASAVKECNLQYVEEPIKAEENIIKFCDESGLPVALDETLDAIKGDFVNHLQKYAHPRIAAIFWQREAETLRQQLHSLQKAQRTLPGLKIKGKINDDVGLLTELTYLTLQGCNFTGTIPTTIGNLNLFQGY